MTDLIIPNLIGTNNAVFYTGLGGSNGVVLVTSSGFLIVKDRASANTVAVQAANIQIKDDATGFIATIQPADTPTANATYKLPPAKATAAGQVLLDPAADGELAWQFPLMPLVPQGRLTLSSSEPVPTTNVTGSTAVYYLPYNGNRVPLYNGSEWSYYELGPTGTSASLSGLTANTNYDVFIYDSSGLTLDLTAWTNDTTRATSITLQNGMYVKDGATGRLYVGTVRMVATGAAEDSLTKRYCWNMYNQHPRKLLVQESTDSWTYSTATWRYANNSSANQVEVVCGLLGRGFAHLTAGLLSRQTQGNAGFTGIGIAAAQNDADIKTKNTSEVSGTDFSITNFGILEHYPRTGYTDYRWVEYVSAGTVTFYGDNGGATFKQSGMTGYIYG